MFTVKSKQNGLKAARARHSGILNISKKDKQYTEKWQKWRRRKINHSLNQSKTDSKSA